MKPVWMPIEGAVELARIRLRNVPRVPEAAPTVRNGAIARGAEKCYAV